jgi:hypothetical protein
MSEEADQHVSGAAETGTFTTDQAPTGDTPSHHGSDTEITSAPSRNNSWLSGQTRQNRV